MKLFRVISLVLLAAFCSLTVPVFALPGLNAVEFSVKEYEDFHRVLHPLQHEALPKKDFPRIRSAAPEFVKLGAAIVKLGVPRGTKPGQVDEFQQELNKFRAALGKFETAAKSGTDADLEASFSSLHDSFEMLAALLPRPAEQSRQSLLDRVLVTNARVVVYDGIATGVMSDPTSTSDLWLTTADLTRATRLVIKPRGVCRDQLCFPLPKVRRAEFIAKKGSITWFNLSRFAELIKQPVFADQKNGVWYFGALPEERNYDIASFEARPPSLCRI